MQVFYQHLNDMCHDMLESEDNTDSEEGFEQNPSPPKEKKTRTKRIILAKRTEDGELVSILSVFFNRRHPPSQRLRFESFSEGLFDSGREKIVGFQT